MRQTVQIAVLIVLATSQVVSPQQAPNASGHWVGTVDVPSMPIDVEVDLARAATGDTSGTITIPAQQLRGLPLTKVQQNGLGIIFEARTDQGFTATLSGDGNSMAGYYQMQDYTFPFTMTRMGTAKIDPPPTSPRISSALEGTWNGTMAVNNTRMRIVLTLANRSDGRSAGSVINLDQGSLQMPVATIMETGSQVTLGLTVIPSSFSGTLNAERGELTGTYMQGTTSIPVTFTHQAAGR